MTSVLKKTSNRLWDFERGRTFFGGRGGIRARAELDVCKCSCVENKDFSTIFI